MAEFDVARNLATIFAAVAAGASAGAAWLSLGATKQARLDRRRPAVVVTKGAGGRWGFQNAGEGPALNIVWAVRKQGGAWASHGVLAPLTVGQAFEIPLGMWPIPEGEIGAVYFDVFGNPHHTVLSGHTGHTIAAGDHRGIREARAPGEIAEDLATHGASDLAQSYDMQAVLALPRR